MNKSDLEKMKKVQEEYEKYLKESPLHSVIDEIAKDIRDRQNNVMAMEFTRTIAELLRENGIVIHCEQQKDTEEFNGKSIEIKYGVRFDGVDCTKHDRQFTDRIAELEKECAEKQKQIGDLEKRLEIFSKVNCFVKSDVFKDPVQAYINSEVSVKEAEIKNLQDKISELEAELSTKEHLLKTKNGLCGEKSRDNPSAKEYVENSKKNRFYSAFACAAMELTKNDILVFLGVLAKELIENGIDFKFEMGKEPKVYDVKFNKDKIIPNLIPKEPIKVADLITENFKQGTYPIYERDSKGNIKYMDIDGEKYAVETGMYRKYEEVRQIAEHLLVYCNHNSENKGEV